MKAKVAILVAAHRSLELGTALDMAKLVRRAVVQGTELAIIGRSDAILPRSRQELVREALRKGATHLLCIDSDMRFPSHALDRLLGHREPFVACNYPQRRPPYTWTASDGKPVETSADSPHLQPVNVVGLGLALLRAELFHGLDLPWFLMPWDATKQDFMGEDAYLCLRILDRYGIRPLVDHDLSRKVAHVGALDVDANVVRLHQWISAVVDP